VIAKPSNATHPNMILAIVTLVSRDKRGRSPEKCSAALWLDDSRQTSAHEQQSHEAEDPVRGVNRFGVDRDYVDRTRETTIPATIRKMPSRTRFTT
jgi:hypothetical protein